MDFETYIKDRAEPGSGLYLAIKEAWETATKEESLFGERKMATIATQNEEHGYKHGDLLKITTLDQRRWKRFLHWITFRKPPTKTEVVEIRATSSMTLTIK